MKKNRLDMCHGPLAGPIFRFTLPIIAANVITLLFHTADLIVLGQFADPSIRALAAAAVGATSTLNILLVCFFMGFSTGVNAITARYIGAKDHRKVSESVHTAMAVALYGGVIFALLGVILARSMLVMLDTPPEVLDRAVTYFRIISLGSPFLILYSVGSAILRSIGDTRRPFIFIILAGFVNVILNIFFVTVLDMDAAGVALATKIANLISALLVLNTLRKSHEIIRLDLKKLRFHWETLKEILWIGIPAAFNSTFFHISNLFVQSAINSLGALAMAGNVASLSLESIANISSTGFYQAAMTFVGQNLGAKKYKRVIRVIMICVAGAVTFSVVNCTVAIIFRRPLLALYNPDPVVINWALERFMIMMFFNFLICGSDAITGALRGLGESIRPAIISCIGVCGFRIFWVTMVFPDYGTMRALLISYPISWGITLAGNGLLLLYICRRMLQQARNSRELNYLTIRNYR